ncbi:MAG: pyridoxal phosphate-dependent aminotransferase [Staphylococcus sp.]|nr:pyridoxal phosphate-dependent aminotransferase [Staphylococcus sp.]
MSQDFNFDKIVLRRGTGSYKWDSRHDVIPLWVADMDFQTAPCIIEALRRRVDHGVFGYTYVGESYYDALIDWFSSRHLYTIDRRDVIYVPGVVPAISAIIKALAPEGSGVIVQTPVYNCFFSSIRNNGCHIVENPLLRNDISDREFTYSMDFDGLEKLAADPANRLLLLCNPHNPAGRAWTREELSKLSEICRRNGVTVVSDEIHNELTMPGYRYIPYGTIDPEAIICLSPSKSFNTAGLQIANIIAPVEKERALIDRAVNINEVCDVNPFGVEALRAAYSSEGSEWLEALRRYLHDNYLFLREYLGKRLPQCPIARLEATYLPWVDISALDIKADDLAKRLLDDARVWVNSGMMYGSEGYIRLNIACPRSTLEEALERICDTLS